MGNAPSVVESVLFHEYEARVPDQRGKNVVVTGCTTGTGQIFARTAARNGATVIMVNRASPRVEALKEWMKAEAPDADKEERLHYVDGDLQSFESVEKCIVEITRKYEQTGIDVLMNNAGVMALADQATIDGYDVQMQTNHLSHFQLTRGLYPLLLVAAEKRGEAVVVNHSSLARNGGPLKRDYLGRNGGSLGGNGASMLCGGARWERYHQTKLANVVFTVALHEKLQASASPHASKIRSVVAAPGLARTQLQFTTGKDGGMNENASFMKFSQSPEDGTLPILACAFGFEPTTHSSGIYVKSGELWEPIGRMGASGHPGMAKMSGNCRDKAAVQMLWEESENACGKFDV